METQHTQGNWKVDEKRNLAQNEFSLFAGNKYIGRFTLAAPYSTGSGNTIKESTDEMYANAKLIASAPELLEALKNMVSWIESMEHGEQPGFSFNMAKETIKKAIL